MPLTRPSAAQINTVITTISDPVTVLNKGSTAANIDVGFIINRNGGALANTAIFWNESANTFATAFTTASGATDANISISTYANLRVGTLTATFVNAIGNVSAAVYTGGAVNVSGNILSTGLSVFGNTSIGSLATPGAQHTIIGNVDVSGAGTEYFNIGGNVLAVQGSFGSINSTGFINTSGNISGAVLNSGAINSTGFINTTANISAAQINSATAVVTGSAFVGELFVTNRGGDEGGQLNLASAVTNNSLSGNVIIDIFQNRLRIFEGGGTNRGGYFDISGLSASAGTNLAAGGGGGTPGGGQGQIQFNSSSTFQGAASLYYFGANGAIVANAGIASTSTTTGTMQITGGIGVSGNVWADQIYAVNNGNGRNIRIGDDAWLGDVNVADTLQLSGVQNSNNGYLRFGNVGTETLGRAGAGTLTWTGGFGVSGPLYANATTVSTSTTTGALIVAGGIGAAGAIFSAQINTTGNVLSTGLSVFGNARVGLAGAVSGQFHTVVGNITQTSSGGAVYINTTGNISAAVATFGSMTNTGTSTVAVLNSTGNILSTGAIHNSLTVNGATTQAGTLTVTSGFINSSGNIVATGGVLSSLTVNGNTTITGNTYLNTGGFTIFGASNLDQSNSTANLALYQAAGRTIMGWNYSAGRGEFDIICDRDGGAPGGLRIYDWSTANVRIANVLMDINYSQGLTVYGNVSPSTSNTYTLGSTTSWWTTTFSKAMQAQYADLAEVYSSDQQYPAGTVVVFGGEAEVMQSNSSHDPRIAGVVSTEPAYLMNGSATGIPVALQGRVPCRVLGPVAKGDRLVASQHPGIAQRLNKELYEPGCIIGKALQDIETTTISTIEVVVGRL